MKAHLLRSAARLAMTGPLAGVLGRHRRRGHEAEIDPQVAAVLALERLLRLPPLDALEPVHARRYAEEALSPFDVAPAPMAEVIDTAAPGPAGAVPVRIYVPPGASRHWIVYFHGGGGVIGSIRSSEPVARMLAMHTRCTVASVGYRLGPEARHPAAIEDALAAYAAMVARVPAGGRVAVAGDSFGGFVAVHVERAAARRPDLQVLIYPLVDLTLSSPSIERNAVGYLLTHAIMRYFRSHYLHPEHDRRAASPRFWQDLRGSAPAIIATAGFDPLVDEGDAWAEALRAAQVTVRHRRHPSLVHGFLSLAGGVREARRATEELFADVRELL